MREVELRKILEFGARGTGRQSHCIGFEGIYWMEQGVGGWLGLPFGHAELEVLLDPRQRRGRLWALSGVQGRGAGLETARWDGTAQG